MAELEFKFRDSDSSTCVFNIAKKTSYAALYYSEKL